MNDRNKTELTQNITRHVSLWMDGKGFKPVETEVGVEQGWVADVAGVCCPTQTENIELKLINRPPRWRYDPDCANIDEFNTKYAAWRTRFDAIPKRLTALVEVKTSVGDFRGDRKWTSPWPTNLCYVAMPEGMIPQEKWPKGWGVILFSQEGTSIRKVHPPASWATVTTEQQLNVILSLAVVRDHKTRYASMREHQKVIRISQGERTTVTRVQNAIGFVRSVMSGKTIEEAMSYHGIRTKLPSYVLKDLQTLVATPTVAADSFRESVLSPDPSPCVCKE